LEKAGSPKRFQNLFGATLGTGFGGGIVRKGELFTGDNSSADEIWLMRNKRNPACNAEEGASIRAVKRTYAGIAGVNFEQAPTPKDIYEIAVGRRKGDRDAAIAAFDKMAEVVGDALAKSLTLIDGLVVIGGGVSGAHALFLPSLVKEINTPYLFPDGQTRPRLVSRVYNLEDINELDLFLRGEKIIVSVPGRGTNLSYDPLRRIGVGMSRLGTSKAVSVKAYAFALHALDTARSKE
jgi:glucokinase